MMNKKGSIVLGFTFTIMIATSVVFYFKETEIQNQMQIIKRESLIVNLDMVRFAVEKAFEDPRVISQTFYAAENQSGTVGMLACLTNPNISCENIEKDLVLYAQIPGKFILNPLPLPSGKYFGLSFKSSSCAAAECNNLMMKEFTCDTFEAGVASDDCIFRLRTTWKPLCPSFGPCLKPKIVWMLKLERNNASQLRIGSINPNRYYVEKIF
jgi:hypothetical protein